MTDQMGIPRVFGSVAEKGSNATNALAYRIIRAQALATILASAICLSLDWVAAYSVMLGGLASVVPSAFFAWRLLRRTASAGMAAGHMVMAEAGKFALTVAIFIAVFALVKPLDAALFFGSFVGVYAFHVLVPAFERASNGKDSS